MSLVVAIVAVVTDGGHDGCSLSAHWWWLMREGEDGGKCMRMESACHGECVSGVSVSAAGEGSEGLTVCVLWWWSTREGGCRQTSHRRHRRASVCCRYIDAIVDPRQKWPYVGIVVVTVAHLGSRSLSLSSFVQVGAQTTPRRGVVYSLCVKRGIPGGQICLSCPLDAPLLRLGPRTVHTGTGKGRVWACGFEPAAKALVRGLNRYPDRRPSGGCLGELPSTTYEGSRLKRVSWQRPDARMV